MKMEALEECLLEHKARMIEAANSLAWEQSEKTRCEALLAETLKREEVLASQCRDWNEVYQAVGAEVSSLRNLKNSSVRSLRAMKLQRNVALVLFVVAVLALLGLLVWHFI
jgi:hypothetical protein